VSNVALELAQLRLNRADVLTETRAHSVLLMIEPESVSIRASSMVISEDVVRMSNPETTRRLISVE